MTDQPSASLSAIVATIDRAYPIINLLDSLTGQTVLPREVIIVDQNIEPLSDEFLQTEKRPFPIHHMHRPTRHGVSWARNIGWKEAKYDWLLFPDDDCWYPQDYIEKALAIAQSNEARIVTGRPTDHSGRTINGRFEKTSGLISRRTVLTSQIEWNMLIWRDLMNELGGYDEAISLGGPTPWQGGEGYDLLLRALARNARCYFEPSLIAHHEELPVARPDGRMIKKGRDYARGLGRVLKVNGFGPGTIAYWTARSCANWMFSVFRFRTDRMRYFGHQAIGRIEGYLGVTLPPRHQQLHQDSFEPKSPEGASQKP